MRLSDANGKFRRPSWEEVLDQASAYGRAVWPPGEAREDIDIT
ncbi:hypothetical protein ACH429_02345 [Streptomyces pathocidini]|uniref:Uncharacterized protein n=1 Tax=Streptomyces pathocidini TaxID=1650571 RepID=A0ABW7UNM0_9ACTN|nr:hypothetical protein [Streptomyces pathocidini]